MKKKPAWSNWSGLHSVTPREILQPASTEEVADHVRTALREGRHIRAVGSGHSFTAAAVAHDKQLDLTKLQGITRVNAEKQQVTVKAGTKLWQIPPLLTGLRLAMQNLGDINRQSISGAISTSTHGTGLKFGGLGSQVAGVEMVTGTGDIITITDSDSDLLDKYRVTLGAYGVITEVTLQLVPDYDLRVVEGRSSLDTVLANWRELNTRNDHFEFFWFGHSADVVTKASQRLAPESLPRTPHGFKERLQDEAVGNGAFSAVCQLGRAVPRLTPQLNRLTTAAWGTSDRVKHWSEGFASPRRVRFNEMEYAVPFDAVPDVIRELRQVFQRTGIESTFPLEVRAAAADSGHLATNHGRETGYIAVHKHISHSHRDYFAPIEEVLQAYDGRPHWGKLHTLTAPDLAARYPRWEDALALRDKHDPHRLFTNDYLTQVFGR